jgi:hypothetical protein
LIASRDDPVQIEISAPEKLAVIGQFRQPKAFAIQPGLDLLVDRGGELAGVRIARRRLPTGNAEDHEDHEDGARALHGSSPAV